MIKENFKPLARDFFTSRGDSQDPRLGDIVKSISDLNDITKDSYTLMGYPHDDGIKLNGGRVGAGLAPSAIRKVLYKMTPSLGGEIPRLFDLGNLEFQASFSEIQKIAEQTVMDVLQKKTRAITIGGGHDFGYPDFSAFCKKTILEGHRPFIINFDAHLDVRPDNKGPNSGTSFYQLLNEFDDKIDFVEVGIQDWCNARAHLEWAQKKGAQIITFNEWLFSGLSFSELMNRRVLSRIKPDHRLALSVDIDFFSSSIAPGASQVFPVGMSANEFLVFWKHVLTHHAPSLAGFYEVSPTLDLDDRTAKLCAILIHQFIFRT